MPYRVHSTHFNFTMPSAVLHKYFSRKVTLDICVVGKRQFFFIKHRVCQRESRTLRTAWHLRTKITAPLDYSTPPSPIPARQRLQFFAKQPRGSPGPPRPDSTEPRSDCFRGAPDKLRWSQERWRQQQQQRKQRTQNQPCHCLFSWCQGECCHAKASRQTNPSRIDGERKAY